MSSEPLCGRICRLYVNGSHAEEERRPGHALVRVRLRARAIQHNVAKVTAVVRSGSVLPGMPFPLAKRPHIQIELSGNLGGGRTISSPFEIFEREICNVDQQLDSASFL